jgi:hypothetical protein
MSSTQDRSGTLGWGLGSCLSHGDPLQGGRFLGLDLGNYPPRHPLQDFCSGLSWVVFSTFAMLWKVRFEPVSLIRMVWGPRRWLKTYCDILRVAPVQRKASWWHWQGMLTKIWRARGHAGHCTSRYLLRESLGLWPSYCEYFKNETLARHRWLTPVILSYSGGRDQEDHSSKPAPAK